MKTLFDTFLCKNLLASIGDKVNATKEDTTIEKDNAIADWRKLMGATNPDDADEGTIRKDFAENIESNTSHGSDAPETAAFEIAFFFSQLEILS